MNWRDRIVADPGVLVGKPVIKGTRISVELIFDMLSRGHTEQQVLSQYDFLKPEDIHACYAYAYEILGRGWHCVASGAMPTRAVGEQGAGMVVDFVGRKNDPNENLRSGRHGSSGERARRADLSYARVSEGHAYAEYRESMPPATRRRYEGAGERKYVEFGERSLRRQSEPQAPARGCLKNSTPFAQHPRACAWGSDLPRLDACRVVAQFGEDWLEAIPKRQTEPLPYFAND